MGLASSVPIRSASMGTARRPTRQDQMLLDTVVRSAVRLPHSFIVWRTPNAPTVQRWDAVLVRAQSAEDRGAGVWRLHLEDEPLRRIGTGHLAPSTLDPWFGGQEHTILVERRRWLSNFENIFSLRATTVRHAGWTLCSVSTDETYPVLTFTDACEVMPIPFEALRERVNANWRFEAAPGLVDQIVPAFRTLMTMAPAIPVPAAAAAVAATEPSAPRVGGPVQHEETEEGGEASSQEEASTQHQPPPEPESEHRRNIRHAMAVHEVALAYSHLMDKYRDLQRDLRRARAQVVKVPYIPQHIVNTHLEVLVAKGETCPLDLNPLQLEETVLTPCGHAMSDDVGMKWIEVAEECPVCRATVKPEQLQRWTP